MPIRWLILLAALTISPGRADDFGSWHALSFRYLHSTHWDLTAFAQLRYHDDSSELFAYYLSQQVSYKVSPYLKLGMNYTYLPTKPIAGDEFVDQYRWETEIIPRWPINERLTLDLRNRLELRWFADQDGVNKRSRHRPQAIIRVIGMAPLESLSINNEFFYDYDIGEYNENRLIPLGLNFRLHPEVNFSLYYMLVSVRPDADWFHTHTLGTQLSLHF